MKIGICGKICSGKTTISNYLIDSHSFKKYSFGTAVKNLATEFFGMDPNKKNRILLQTIGQTCREILFPEVWIETTLRKIERDGTEFAVIDDVRYLNEFDILKKNGWIIIKIDISPELQIQRIKDTYPDTYQQHLNNLEHISEKEMDEIDLEKFDLIIDSNMELYEIYDTIQKINKSMS